MNLVQPASDITGLADPVYPPILPLQETADRPFWSVMIPTYNCTRYLEECLESVLRQDPGPSAMQIEIVDDSSPNEYAEEIVRRVGRGRVVFFRQPTRLGLAGNWNACITRARGRWVHILHQDDFVIPGFYGSLAQPLQANPRLMGAFSRYAYVDEQGHWQGLSRLEQNAPGILHDWLERIAVTQRIQAAAIVVGRHTYEQIGGFCPDLHYALDWEMWKRIAAHGPVWYEPKILACFRNHAFSTTARFAQTGADIADIRRAIEISRAYFPPERAPTLSAKALEYYALYAVQNASRMYRGGNTPAARAQLREALRCSRSARVILAIVRLCLAALIPRR